MQNSYSFNSLRKCIKFLDEFDTLAFASIRNYGGHYVVEVNDGNKNDLTGYFGTSFFQDPQNTTEKIPYAAKVIADSGCVLTCTGIYIDGTERREGKYWIDRDKFIAKYE